jgi:ribosomal protein S18 acetylase RimI-like enzyme
MIVIEEATVVTDELMMAFNRLVPQLSSSNPAPSREQLTEMVNSPATIVLIARDTDRDQGAIIGSLTLAVFRIPTAMRAWIEDVVVDTGARGQGVGEALVRNALEAAARVGAKTVDLTSRSSREAANRLYVRVGFEKRDTNIYRFNITKKDETQKA